LIETLKETDKQLKSSQKKQTVLEEAFKKLNAEKKEM